MLDHTLMHCSGPAVLKFTSRISNYSIEQSMEAVWWLGC